MAKVPELVPQVAAFLVSKARQHRRTTYKEVAEAVGTHPRVVPKTLEVIRALCIEKRWPALTSIVVSATTGKPGEAFLDPWLARDTVAAAKDGMTESMQEQVYAFDWAPLLARYGKADAARPYFPITVTIRAEHVDGAIRITFPGEGVQTTLDGVRNPRDLYEHLKRLLVQARQWPER